MPVTVSVRLTVTRSLQVQVSISVFNTQKTHKLKKYLAEHIWFEHFFYMANFPITITFTSSTYFITITISQITHTQDSESDSEQNKWLSFTIGT